MLRAITHLATLVSKWSKACDRMLHRLMAYVSQSTDYTLVGCINDSPEDLWLAIYTDSDFSGSPDCAHSTSGAWLQLRGPSSVWPLSWASKKQTAVSRSTTQAELIAMVFGVFSEALPMEVLWSTVLQREVHTVIYEDNEATEKIVRPGFSQKLRHITRTHKVNLGSLRDVVVSSGRTLKHVKSAEQIADVFTKAVEQHGWQNALRLLGMTTSVLETVKRSMASFKLQQHQRPKATVNLACVLVEAQDLVGLSIWLNLNQTSTAAVKMTLARITSCVRPLVPHPPDIRPGGLLVDAC